MIELHKIRIVEDFPTPGIKFFDITTLMNDADAFRQIIDALLEEAKKFCPEVIVALEARGYFFAPPLALALNIPFVPIRKKGKLPFDTYTQNYQLEYGEASIEIHKDAIKPDQRVLIFDDVLATGGTAQAATQLVNHFNPADINFLFLLELSFLNGREKLENYPTKSLLTV